VNKEIVIAGFGGQGVLSMGMTIAYAGMVENLEVAWMPSYGPEMRGGTANCVVILSDQKISSPIINEFDTAIILNQPSMEKFESMVKPNGEILFEASTILSPPTRNEIRQYKLPANAAAQSLNNKRIMNMIILGAFTQLNPILHDTSIMTALKKVLPERHHHLLPINEKALHHGKNLITGLEIA